MRWIRDHAEVWLVLSAVALLASLGDSSNRAPAHAGFGHHARPPIEASLITTGPRRTQSDTISVRIERRRAGMVPVDVELRLPEGVTLEEGSARLSLRDEPVGTTERRWRVRWPGPTPPSAPAQVHVDYRGQTAGTGLRERFAARMTWQLGAAHPTARALPQAPAGAKKTTLGGRPLGRGRRTR